MPYKMLSSAFVKWFQIIPNSPYAPIARERMIFLRNTFAQRELEISMFYYNRGAYAAAINRADYIV